MHFAAEVVDARALGFVEQEHRGERREAHVVEILAREQRELHVHDGFGARNDRETVGAGGRFALEQRVHDQAAGVGAGTLDPEPGERRELLSHRMRGAQSEAAGGQSVVAAAIDRAKIGGALGKSKNSSHTEREFSRVRTRNPDSGRR